MTINQPHGDVRPAFADQSTQRRPLVLFVDDDAQILRGLNRFMRTCRASWTSRFAGGGEDALSVLAAEAIDLVVTDMRMPGMDGAALLEWISHHQPWIMRIVLSGEADVAATDRIVGRSHQFLTKPCAPETLTDTISQILLTPWMEAVSTCRDSAAFFDHLTTHPDVYEALATCLAHSGTSMADVTEIIASDPGLAVRICQLVNSGYFGRPMPTLCLHRAVSALGLERIRALMTKERLGQAARATASVRGDLVFGNLARKARSFGEGLTDAKDQLDTIYATALFAGLGSRLDGAGQTMEPQGTVSMTAAFATNLLGLPECLTRALSAVAGLPITLDDGDLIEAICTAVVNQNTTSEMELNCA